MHAGHFGLALECRGLPAAPIGQRETVYVVESSFRRDEVQSPPRLENAVSPGAGHLRVFWECNAYENSKLVVYDSQYLCWLAIRGNPSGVGRKDIPWCLWCLSRPEIRPKRTKQKRQLKQ